MDTFVSCCMNQVNPIVKACLQYNSNPLKVLLNLQGRRENFCTRNTTLSLFGTTRINTSKSIHRIYDTFQLLQHPSPTYNIQNVIHNLDMDLKVLSSQEKELRCINAFSALRQRMGRAPWG